MEFEITIYNRITGTTYTGYWFECYSISCAVILAETFLQRWTRILPPEQRSHYEVSFPTIVGGFKKQSLILNPYQLRAKCRAIADIRKSNSPEEQKKLERFMRYLTTSSYPLPLRICYEMIHHLKFFLEHMYTACKRNYTNKPGNA